jgi:hypothetical protein
MKKYCFLIFIICSTLAPFISASDGPVEKFYMRGAIYLDWFGAKYQGIDFASQFSLRMRMELLNQRGSGWSLLLDTRNRLKIGESGYNQLILYDACLSFEQTDSPLYLSFGQMNLYDSAGIGQLFGGALGFKPTPDLLLGGYAGLESNIYVNRLDKEYQKFGIFARYRGRLGKRLSLSYNHIRYSGVTEHRYFHTVYLYPIKKYLVIFGNMEYGLGPDIHQEDRLSRLFINCRFDPYSFLDVSAVYSSGKGLDFHQYAINKSQDPGLNDRQLERYYYSKLYGIRLGIKPTQTMRFYVSRQEREQKDDNIRNHSWIFGSSFLNILNSGISAYGSFSSNRGKISESDSYYISLSKDFGKVSWNSSFSNTYNSLRYNYNSGLPQLIHLDGYKTISNFLFIILNRSLAVSVEYEYFIQELSNQHLFFIRLIYRN